MASGLIFDPTALLRVAPLASSTGTVAHAVLELFAFSSFVQPHTRKDADGLLPRVFPYVFNRAVCTVVALNLTTVVSSIANIRSLRHRSPWPLSRSTFYWAGLVAAIGHMLFVPLVAKPVQRIFESSDEDGQPSRDMERWLAIHRVRMLVADLPGWLAFVGAVLVV
ncbi:putative integral membrane protein [Aspergillus candidus]|uniref:Putative integral membrane protein n=1 Tax=Aspergillus candidus TaxID=41067 RepID=A0A2I2FI97_ASPCN|nr:putative integral membrane protein [Aspergillus candidus]PLB40355.1 putative integral membrane protein [Aspergillus candidus]